MMIFLFHRRSRTFETDTIIAGQTKCRNAVNYDRLTCRLQDIAVIHIVGVGKRSPFRSTIPPNLSTFYPKHYFNNYPKGRCPLESPKIKNRK